MKKPILLIDMDEVLADFKGGVTDEEKTEWCPETMYEDGFFFNLKPISGAMGAVKKLFDSGLFDIHICSTPVAGLHGSYSDKSKWINKYFPYLYNRIILTQNKTLVKADIAIDDRPEIYSSEVRVIDPRTRKANQRFQWHKIAEDLIEEFSEIEKANIVDEILGLDDDPAIPCLPEEYWVSKEAK